MNIYQPMVDCDTVVRIVKSQVGIKGTVNTVKKVLKVKKIANYFRKGVKK